MTVKSNEREKNEMLSELSARMGVGEFSFCAFYCRKLSEWQYSYKSVHCLTTIISWATNYSLILARNFSVFL